MRDPSQIVVFKSNSCSMGYPVDPVTRAPPEYTVGAQRTVHIHGVHPDRVNSETMKLTDTTPTSLVREPVRIRLRSHSPQGQDMSGIHEHRESSSGCSAPLVSSRRDPDSSTSGRSKPSATHTAAYSPQRLTSVRSVIYFYNKNEPHYGFTNFSPHPVKYDEKQYPTSEHLFQSFKFQGRWPGLAEHIRTCSDLPSVAFSEARRFQPQVRSDWIDVNIAKMEETLWHKFTQHSMLKEELLATGYAELVENSADDSFWGIGADGKGRNELGKALERLRAQFREAQPRILVEADPMME